MGVTSKPTRGVPPPPPPAGHRAAEFVEELGSNQETPDSGVDAGGPAPRVPRPRMSTEALFELDAPSRALSRDLDIEIETSLLETGASLVMEHEGELPPHVPGSVSGSIPKRPSPLASMQTEILSAPREINESPEEQRLRRVISRVLCCRDCFRWLGTLGIADEDRKLVGRGLLELDATLGGVEGRAAVIKDPEPALKRASVEQLELVERLIGPIEDRLLALDELVEPAAFRTQLANRKQSKKVVARYGRLLASRRFPVGQRRDRFELIATHLLTGESDARRQRILPPDRARVVLEHLVGGLGRKQNAQEAADAIAHLRQEVERVEEFTSADEFFRSGYFLDVHGFKVSSREQLLNAEFLYLSVLINVEVHNRVEDWISELEHAHDSNQLTAQGTPRQQLMRRLHEQEEAVEDSFGGRRKTSFEPKRSEATAVRGTGASSDPTKKRKTLEPPQAAKASRAGRRFVNVVAVVVALVIATALGAGAFFALYR